MKIRSDYVSNSSSSSFIIIAATGNDMTTEIANKYKNYCNYSGKLEFPMMDFKHEFGWEFENTRDFGGKLNFIAIQLLNLLCMQLNNQHPYYKGDPMEDFIRYYEMVDSTCKNKFGVGFVLNTDMMRMRLTKDDENHNFKMRFSIQADYYIDHQSCVTENECMEMFESEDKLYDFLRFNDSYIQGGNDNER